MVTTVSEVTEVMKVIKVCRTLRCEFRLSDGSDFVRFEVKICAVLSVQRCERESSRIFY